MPDIAFLHTGTIHIETFGVLMHELAPELRLHHTVREDLLQEAQVNGITVELAQRIEAAMGNAAESGARVVVCTCSTIGNPAEGMVTGGAFRAMRIDRAMADAAVQHGRILIVAALESTLGPTLELVKSSAEKLKQSPHISCEFIPAVWAHFVSGDMDRYCGGIVAYLETQCNGYDVIVLAQASMAPAAVLCKDIGIPVLSSPRLGVEAAIEAFINED